MDAKFTPGPWQLQEGNHPAADGRDWEVVSEHVGICGWWAWDDRREERKANAHLIAAAPDMYAEIAQCEVDLEEAAKVLAGSGFPQLASIYRLAAKRARAALAKAEGR